MSQSEITSGSEANLFAQLEVVQSKTSQINRLVLISFGEQNSGALLKLIKKIFKLLGSITLVDNIDNRFYNRAVVVIKKHNFEIVMKEFHIKNAEKDPVLLKLVPSEILLLPNTTQYKAIKKLHDDESLKVEISLIKKAPKSWITIPQPQNHWLDTFTYDLQQDIQALLKGDSSKIHQLNEMKKQNHTLISDEDFGLLVRDVIKETTIKNVTKTQVESVKDIIDFFNQNQFIVKKLGNQLSSNQMEVYNLLEGQINSYDETEKLNFLKFIESEEFVAQQNVLETLKEVIKNFDSIKIQNLRKTDPVAQREDFKIWLKEQKFLDADAIRLYNFFERLADKNIYSPKVIAEALQLQISMKPIATLMDELFPRKHLNFDPLGWFGGNKTIVEADPLDLFFQSAGKQELLKACFKIETREIVKKETEGTLTTEESEKFGNELSDLFKNSHLLLGQDSLSSARGLITFAAILSSRATPSIIMKELQAKNKYFNEFDLEKLAESNKLQPLILKRIEETLVKKAKVKDQDIAAAISKNPTLLMSTVVSTFIEKLFPKTSKLETGKIQKAISTFAPLLNPIFAKSFIQTFLDNNPNLSDEQKKSLREIAGTLSNAMATDQNLIINEVINGLLNTTLSTLDVALELPKKIVKDQLVFKDSNEGNAFHTLIKTIVDTNEIYRMALETKTDLKTLPLPPTEKWLLVGLEDLSKGVPLVNSLTTMIPSFIVNTGGVTEYFAGKIIKNLTASFLADNKEMTLKEREEMAEAASDLAKIILPIIPEIKNKHNLAIYTQFIEDLNSLVHSKAPITGDEVTAKIKGITDHFLDNELKQYYEPIYEAIQSIPTILDKK